VQLKLKYLMMTLTLLPLAAAASEHAAEGGTDIVARSINFLIFAAILYYLIADKIKAWFAERRTGIANQLTEIEEKLNSVKEEKELALKEAEAAKQKAVELIEIAKKEAEALEAKIESDAKREAEQLKKSLQERMDIEEKKMAKSVVSEVIDEMFESGKIALSNEDFVNIIKKKVA